MSLAGIQAAAEEQASESKMTIDSAKDQANKTGGDDVDETLTNNKLRAETGSKSKFSVATAFNYDGGSLKSPLDANRPNIQGINGTTDVADLNGSINMKYNITQKDSILVGGGLRWIAPLQGGQRPDSYPEGQMFDTFDPSINYQHVYKVGSVQSYYQVGPTIYSRTDVLKRGYVANLGIYNVNALDIGHSGVTVGLESQALTNFFNSNDEDLLRKQTDYTFFVYPYLEYALTDKINLRTVTFLWSVEHTRDHDAGTWVQDKVTQSFGVGFSVTRDVFLYPNVQIIPDQLRAADTNVGLAANINLF